MNRGEKILIGLIIFILVQVVPFLCMVATRRIFYKVIGEQYEYPRGYKTMYLLMVGTPILGPIVSLLELGEAIIELKYAIIELRKKHTV